MTDDVFGIVGKKIAGAYEVDCAVAEGGFGVVYRAHHRGFRADVALKCLKIPQQLTSEQHALFLEQFRREAELLFKLSASIPTVVRPLHVDAFTSRNGEFVPYMVLEWLDGETLDAVMYRRFENAEGPYSLPEVLELLTPVARALERAHNFVGPEGPISVVHRDLKPENIFVANVAGQRQVKILDFGIGKAKSVASQVAGRQSQTQAGFSPFTPAYGAPEQWVPKTYGQTGPWTDVYGLALVLVEMLVGHPVMEGDHAAMMGTTLDPQRRPTPRTEGAPLSDAAEAVFAKALALDPRQRYQEAGEFWDALEQAGRAPAPIRSQPRQESFHEIPKSFATQNRVNAESTTLLQPPSSSRVPHSQPSWMEDSGVLPPSSVKGGSGNVNLGLSSGQVPIVMSRAMAVNVERRPYSGPSLGVSMRPGLLLLAAALAVTGIGVSYANMTGELLVVGPVHASWGAAALGILGVGQIVRELLKKR